LHNCQHVAEIPYENQLVADVHKVNHGTVTYLDKIDFLQNNLLAAHSVWVDDNEVNFFAYITMMGQFVLIFFKNGFYSVT
jgi:cytosine/adenosine deaminase-related metal-dependent hydrolase